MKILVKSCSLKENTRYVETNQALFESPNKTQKVTQAKLMMIIVFIIVDKVLIIFVMMILFIS